MGTYGNGFCTAWAGQADHRQRDTEFAAQDGPGAQDLLARLRATVEEAVTLFRTLPGRAAVGTHPAAGLRGYRAAAIYHVVEHFAGHTFQIMLLTKQFTGEDLGFYAHLGGSQPRKDPLP